MQTNNQNRFGIRMVSVGLLLNVLAFSCSKYEYVDPIGTPAPELATIASDKQANTYQGQQTWEYDDLVWIPCADDGAGEYVQFNGYVHFSSVTIVNNNHFTLVNHINPNDVSGTGLTTGRHYVATGGGEQTYSGSFINGQSVAGGSTKFLFVGAGSNFSVTFKAHVIVNANGEVSNQLQDSKYSCN